MQTCALSLVTLVPVVVVVPRTTERKALGTCGVAWSIIIVVDSTIGQQLASKGPMRCSQCAAGRRNAKTPSTLPYVPGGCWVLGRLLRDCHNRNFTLFYSPSPCGRNGRFSSFAFLIPTTFIWSGFTWKPGNPTQRSRRSFPNGLSLYHTVLCITDVSTFRLNSLSCCFYVPPGRVCTKGICMCIKLCYIVCQIIRSVAAPPVWLPGAYTPCRPLRWYYAPVHMHKIHIHT